MKIIHIFGYSILIVTLILSHVVRNWYVESRAIVNIEINRGIVTYNSNSLMSSIYKHVNSVTFNNVVPENAVLLYLNDLSELQSLHFYGDSITESQLIFITNLQIEYLHFENIKIGNVGLMSLQQMNKLKVISLRNVDCADLLREKLKHIKVIVQ